jgi:hypothetical protein
VGKAHLCELGGLISFADEIFDGLELKGLRFDANNLTSVKSVTIQLLEVSSLENDTDCFVEVLFLLDRVTKSIGYTARFCNAKGLAELARLAVSLELGVGLALRLAGLV